MSTLLEFSMFPTDKGESVSAYVSPLIAMIRDSGVSYRLTPMGTIVETDTLEQALEIVARAYRVLEEAGCNRVYSSLKLDIRKGHDDRLQGKIESVQQKIGAVEH
ncbi:MAG TPA: MTH1187 family thiamine-binding protein [Sedimenticola thiotaurini]|uniref:MTH1187 family thiamine-binding protein n=1 Tax=Sedimenticola thiotaurini TaxID=1543721 RepID=A0A831RLB7_9GAMM|nr:MTH1187 family thiamine-binding protein [Sedimenticola thiotaurini]